MYLISIEGGKVILITLLKENLMNILTILIIIIHIQDSQNFQ